MNWFTKLFKEDTTLASEQDKKLYVSLLKECETFYRHFADVPQYKQYTDAFKEMQEESSFIQSVTHCNIEKLIRLLQARGGGLYAPRTMHYPGAEKIAIQYLLSKERLSKES
jgi:hypothetical protein